MNVPDPRERPTITVEEAAKLLGTGRSATYEAIRAGQLPSIKVGRRVLVPVAALRQLLGIDAPATAAPDSADRSDAGFLGVVDPDSRFVRGARRRTP